MRRTWKWNTNVKCGVVTWATFRLLLRLCWSLFRSKDTSKSVNKWHRTYRTSVPLNEKKKKKKKGKKKACFVMDIYGLYIWHELSSLSDVTELRPLSDSISTYKVLIWMWVTVSWGSVMYRQNPQGRYLQNQSTGNFPSYIFSSAITVQWTSIRCKGIKESFGLFLVSVKMYVLLGI